MTVARVHVGDETRGCRLVISKLLEMQDVHQGDDVQKGLYVDMIDAGIIDPTKVMRLALQTAASVASQLITTNVLLVEPPDSGGHLPAAGSLTT